jgi:peroxiredoxin
MMPFESPFVPVGSKTPDFTLPAVRGGEVSLSDFRGERCVILVFLRGFL